MTKALGRWALFAALCLISATPQAANEAFASSDPAKRPHSVPLDALQERVNSDPFAAGGEFAISVKDRVLRIDLVAIPGDASAAVALRVLFMIGRIAEAEYDEVRLTDEGKDVFLIEGTTFQDIGAQFVWGEAERGQNPIHLIRLLADALRYPDGRRVAAPFNGSLLGDTNRAVTAINEHVHRHWTLPTTRLK